MKKVFWISLLALAGCSSHWVYTPAPATPISMQTASVASGVLAPRDFYFTLISQYEPAQQQTRAIILAEPALKLADLTVSGEQIQVHERAGQVPNKLIRAWGQLVREYFLTPCPKRTIVQQSANLKGTFELEVTGGICL